MSAATIAKALRGSLQRVRTTEANLTRARIREVLARDVFCRAEVAQRAAPNATYARAIRVTQRASALWVASREAVDLADSQARDAWEEARRVLAATRRTT